MVLQNNICNINISIDHTYTIESADNKSYDLIINPIHLNRNDMYRAFSIEINLFYKTISIFLQLSTVAFVICNILTRHNTSLIVAMLFLLKRQYN